MIKLPEREGADAGITLIELVVAMTIMSIVMAIFTTGILNMYRSTAKVDSLSSSAEQVNTAFLRLDGQIRYASAISLQGSGASGDPYVEYLVPAGAIPNLTPTGATTATCVELSIHGTQLRYRVWPQNSAPSGTGVPLISSVTNGWFQRTPDPPTYPAGNNQFQRLEIKLTVTIGTSPSGAATQQSSTRDVHVTFTAMNSSTTANTDATCTAYRS